MRQFEVLLIASNLLALLAIVFPTFPGQVRKRALLIALTVVLGMQLFFEGARWQLTPAYLLSFLLLTIYLLMERPRAISADVLHSKNRIAGFFVSIVGGSILVATVSLSLLLPVFSFELPTGRYEIGTATYHWVDRARSEAFSIEAKAHRELMVQIWYPATPDTTLPVAAYVEDAGALSAAQARLHGWPSFVLEHLKHVKSNARPKAKFVKGSAIFPVILFIEGITGYRQMNTFQIEELVSHGYIVVGIDQPFIAATVVFPDGREIAGLSKDQMNPLIQQSISPAKPAPVLNGIFHDDGIIPYFAQDAVFVLDQLELINKKDPRKIFTGRLDLKRSGIFGVSLGGIIVGEACRIDLRLRACLVMDAPMTAKVVSEGLKQPAMWITRDAQTMRNEGWNEFDIQQHQNTMRAVFDETISDGYFAEISGMFHANLTDVPNFSPLLQRAGVTGPIDPKRAHKIINTYTLAFFDQYLAGQPSTILDGGGEYFSELRLEKR